MGMHGNELTQIITSNDKCYSGTDFSGIEKIVDSIVDRINREGEGGAVASGKVMDILGKQGIRKVNSEDVRGLIDKGYIDEIRLSDVNFKGVYEGRGFVVEVYEGGHGFWPGREGIARVNFRHKDLAYSATYCFCGDVQNRF